MLLYIEIKIMNVAIVMLYIHGFISHLINWLIDLLIAWSINWLIICICPNNPSQKMVMFLSKYRKIEIFVDKCTSKHIITYTSVNALWNMFFHNDSTKMFYYHFPKKSLFFVIKICISIELNKAFLVERKKLYLLCKNYN